MQVQTRAVPVFNDDSGRRVRWVRAVAVVVAVSVVLVAAGVVFTLVTQVPLPGLGGLVSPHADAGASRAESGRVMVPDGTVPRRADETSADSLTAVSASGSRTPAPVGAPGAGSKAAGTTQGSVSAGAEPTPTPRPSSTKGPNQHANVRATSEPQPSAKPTKSPNARSTTRSSGASTNGLQHNNRPTASPSPATE
jgi:hypothetical protein